MENEKSNVLTKDKVDSEQFILEIEKRPSIWDSSSDIYSNRQAKRKDWEELVDIFSDEGFSNEEKKVLGDELQKKWKNIRDSYTRELRRLKKIKTGSATDRKSPYVYFSQMSFLSKCSGSVPTEGDKTKEVTGTKARTAIQVGGPYDDIPNKSADSLKRNKKAKPDYNESDLIATLKNSVESRDERDRQAESDHERLFLLSLLPEMKTIPENLKLSTKLEIISIIQRNQTVAFSHGYNNTGYISQHSNALPMQQYLNTYGDESQRWQNPNPASLAPVAIVQGPSRAAVSMLSPNSELSPPERTDSALSIQSMESSSCSTEN